MKFGYILLAIERAISEYRQRDEPIPLVLKDTKVYLEREVELHGEEDDVDLYDLSKLFLKMVGWSH
jgi:hypothetical protein